ncbi:MAG: DUF5063 domain-containing protein [Leptospiraceae bacterium]|nr:DUF5063 domain-containing protein [Leptospiraceae bacterium]
MDKLALSASVMKFLERNTTQSFLNATQNFLNLLEMEISVEEIFWRKIHFALIDLYSTGFNLGEIELDVTENTFNSPKKVSPKYPINLKFSKKYWKVMNPLQIENPIEGDIALDLEDIYHNLKMELEKIKIGTDEAVEDALWQLKFSFQTHWGNHCVDALKILYYFSHDEIF